MQIKLFLKSALALRQLQQQQQSTQTLSDGKALRLYLNDNEILQSKNRGSQPVKHGQRATVSPVQNTFFDTGETDGHHLKDLGKSLFVNFSFSRTFLCTLLLAPRTRRGKTWVLISAGWERGCACRFPHKSVQVFQKSVHRPGLGAGSGVTGLFDE